MPDDANLLADQALLDEAPLTIKRFYAPLGQNSKDQPDAIAIDEVAVLQNVDTNAGGVSVTRGGSSLIANDTGTNLRVPGLGHFYVESGTKYLTRINSNKWESWTGSGSWAAITGFTPTSDLITNFLQVGNKLLALNGTDNVFYTANGTTATDAGNTNTDPPKSRFGIYHQNAAVLAGNLTNRSYIWPSTVLNVLQFDRAARAVKVADQNSDELTALVNLSLTTTPGFIAFKSKSTHFIDTSNGMSDPGNADPSIGWAIIEIDSSHGAVGPRAACAIGASVLAGDCAYLSREGRKYRLRSLKRSINDALGTGGIMSNAIENILDDVNDVIIERTIVFYFDERIFLAVPSGSSSSGLDTLCVLDLKNSDPDQNKWKWSVWTGLNIASISTYFQTSVEYLYIGDGTAHARVFRMFDGSTDDNGTAIDFELQTRRENLGYPELDKIWQFVEFVFLATDDSVATVQAQLDGGGYSTLTPPDVTLEASGPHLPINLPFQLQAQNMIRQVFQLDTLGISRDIQFKLTHGEAGKVINYIGYTLVAFVEPLHLETRSQS